ncbi:MAG: alkaline phosphatase family protein [Kofleriaceae bacterium]|nr:alkaline phosphatase family protein [Kofleriaceae bacterium]
MTRSPAAAALVAALTAALGGGCGGAPVRHALPPGPTVAAPAPRLVVVLVIDQWASWSFATRRALFTGGLGRLVGGGVVAERALHPHAFTYTAAGHALLATGAPPAVTGVIGNGWYRAAEGRGRPAEYDPAALVLPVADNPVRMGPDDGASAVALRVDGVADVLRAHRPGSRSVAIALKARAAVMVAGRRPDRVFWFEESLGGFTTSAAYATSLPAWLDAHTRSHPMTGYLTPWQAGDPAQLARVTGLGDDNPGEGDRSGLAAAFPHDPRAAQDPGKALLHMPAGDRAVVDVAIAAVDGEALGRDDTPDLLAISLSSHDYAGHVWGQESWEVLDLLLALDGELGRLLAHLDATVGADRYAVVVSSDHGAVPLIEHGQHAGARRVRTTEVEAAAEAAMAAELGPGDWIAAVSSLTLYGSARLAAAPAAGRERALTAAAAAVAAVPGVRRAGRFDQLACAGAVGLDAALCASYAAGISGPLFVVPAEGSLITDYTAGTHHDTPGPETAEVPLVVWAPGLGLGAGAWPGPAPTTAVLAPIVAALLGVPAPPAARAAVPAWLPRP